jgi:hypothetical protein
MTDWERREQNLDPPDPVDWNRQMYKVRLFHQLTWDTDYNNASNLLVDGGWKLYKIDLGRAFRMDKKLRRPDSLTQFSKSVLDRLRQLTREEADANLQPWLTKKQIVALMARRDAILQLADKRVDKFGEASVLYP